MMNLQLQPSRVLRYAMQSIARIADLEGFPARAKELELKENPMPTPARFQTLAVIGNGIIGHGIAQIFATAGYDVRMIGRNAQSLDAALERIRASLARFEAHQLITAHDAEQAVARIATSTNLNDAAGAELVIEAVTEDIPLKLEIFGQLDEICPPPAVLASSSGQPAS